MAENIAIVSWPEKSKAYKALSDIRGGSWNLNVQQAAIVERGNDGMLALKDGDDRQLGLGTLGGSLIGALIGVLGGPLGLLLGWSSGALFGSLVDASEAADDTTLLAGLGTSIKPGTTVLIIDLDEDSPDRLDAFVAESGGTLVRRPAAEIRVEVAAAIQAAEAAADEARRVIREQKKEERKEKREADWENLKARFKAAFSLRG